MDEQMNDELNTQTVLEGGEQPSPSPESGEEQEQPGEAGLSGEEKDQDPGSVGPLEDDKPSRFFRRVLIWLVVIAVAFAAGFFVDASLRYQPEREANQELQTEVRAAENRVEELEDEIQRLSVFEERNLALEEDLAAMETHLVVVSTQKAVADTMLALTDDDLAQARLSLDRVGRNLADLVERLNEDQVEVVENMQQRHDLIMEELARDSSAAMSDLEVLASKLVSLENTLFSSP